MLVIQIESVEKNNMTSFSLTRKIEKNRRNTFFFPKPNKKRGQKNMLNEIDSHTALPPPKISDIGPRYIVYMPTYRSEAITDLYLFFNLLVPVGLEQHCL